MRLNRNKFRKTDFPPDKRGFSTNNPPEVLKCPARPTDARVMVEVRDDTSHKPGWARIAIATVAVVGVVLLASIALLRQDLGLAVTTFACLGITAVILFDRYWARPTRAVRRLLPTIRAGEAAVTELDAVAGPIGTSALVPLLQAALRDHKTLAAHVDQRIDRQVADKTEALSRKLGDLRAATDRDELTGLQSRPAFDRTFADAVEALDTAGRPIALVMLSIDRLKPLNDALGFEAGDELLGEIGKLLNGHLGPGDQAYRYGGDEFALLVADRKRSDVEALAAQLTTLAGFLAKPLRLSTPPSLSFGVADWHADFANSPNHLLQLARNQLRDAKQESKSRRVA
ncbi:MAG: GGDEF domain-containing protein [Planctomycetota bacterium]